MVPPSPSPDPSSSIERLLRYRAEVHLAPTQYMRVCPECAGPIIRNSGCVHCAQCGWAKCG